MQPGKPLFAAMVFALTTFTVCAQKAEAPQTFVYVGSQSESIFLVRLDPATGHLTYVGQTAMLTRPTWVDVDPKRPILYAVSELGNYDGRTGSVFSFAIDPATGALKQISTASSEGNAPAFVSYDPRVNSLFVAHYTKGRIVAIPVRPDGSIGEATSFQTDYVHGPDKNKQPALHAHQAILDPGGHFVLVPDIGADRVFIYHYDAEGGALSPANQPYIDFAPGTGPRDVVFSPDGHFLYTLTDHTAEVGVFGWNTTTGQPHLLQSVTTDPPNFKGKPSGAELRISADGRFVYTSNRGTNSFQVFAVDKGSGKLSLVQDFPSEGESPRSFAVDPSGHWMIAANQFSNTLSVFAVDPSTGKLAHAGDPVKVGLTPVAIDFYQPQH